MKVGETAAGQSIRSIVRMGASDEEESGDEVPDSDDEDFIGQKMNWKLMA